MMGRHKNTPTNDLTDAQIVREVRPKARYYQNTERKRWPRPCLICGEQVYGTLEDLGKHQDTHKLTQYDYDNQAWIVNGVYEDCGHAEPGTVVDPGQPGGPGGAPYVAKECRCYGRLHKGEKAPSIH